MTEYKKTEDIARWYCIHTRPKKEALVASYFKDNLQLETYFPQLRRKKTIRRIKRVVTEPLFPRYLFCRYNPTHHYRAVRYAKDVIHIVSFGDRPTIVSQATIDQLQEWAGPVLELTQLKPELRPGDRVQIVAGPMRGMEALVIYDLNESDRVAVLLSIMDSEARMTISRSEIERADSH